MYSIVSQYSIVWSRRGDPGGGRSRPAGPACPRGARLARAAPCMLY